MVTSTIPPTETIENPYAAPPAVAEVPDDAEAILKATTRIYRQIGWGGVAYVAAGFTAEMISELLRSPPDRGPVAPPMIGCGLMMLFFMFVLRTASQLGRDFDRVYRRARWLGILAATIWCPISTIPGVLAVRRLERYRRFMVDTDRKHEEEEHGPAKERV